MGPSSEPQGEAYGGASSTGRAGGTVTLARFWGLQARLLLISALVLGTCLGAVGWVLDRSFKAAVRAGAEEQLQAVAYGLLSAAEERSGALAFGAELGEPRLAQPDSGLYAYVERAEDGVIWRSPSSIVSTGDIGERSPLARRPAPGESFFGVADSGGGPSRFVMAYTVIWETLGGAELTFWVLADREPFRRQIVEFRRNTTVGLVSAAVAFVIIQLAALRWGLSPVRRMADRLRSLEAGSRGDIGDDYPRELSGLARNLNRFIAYEKANRDRYRRAMDDLAHSLKTPLAVLKNAMREVSTSDACVMTDQIERMETTITHQLSRAAAVRTLMPATAVPVSPVAARIARALERAYAEKAVHVELLEAALAVRGRRARSVGDAWQPDRERIQVHAQQGAHLDPPGTPASGCDPHRGRWRWHCARRPAARSTARCQGRHGERGSRPGPCRGIGTCRGLPGSFGNRRKQLGRRFSALGTAWSAGLTSDGSRVGLFVRGVRGLT